MNNSSTISSIRKKFNWWAFLYVLVVLFCFYPYEFSSIYQLPLPESSIITAAVFFILTIFLIIAGRKNTTTLNSVSSVFFVQFMGFFIVAVAHMNFLPFFDKILSMLLAVSLVMFVDNRIGLVQFFEKYNRWILLMAILGCVAFFLVVSINFQPLYAVPDKADDRLIYNYILTFSKSDEFSIGIMRYAGFFDEPGAMANWGIFALVINRLFIKNKWLEIILGVSLLFTLSIGYFVQYAAFLLLFHLFGKNRGRILLLVVLLFAIIGGVDMTRDATGNKIYESTFGRVENYFNQSRESSNRLAVGNRATYTENAIKEFKKNPLFGTSRTGVEVGNNVYEPLALYGIIGSVFILFPFILLVIWGIKYNDPDLLKCSIVIILGFTHRPFHANILSLFIIYCIIVMYKQVRLCQQTGRRKVVYNQ